MEEKILLDPYLVGCLLGDGGLIGNLTFANLDQDVIKRVDESLHLYDYMLVKRSDDQKRKSEYSIRPIKNNTVKYMFIYQENSYTATELLTVLQKHGYKITSHDTLLSIVGMSTKTKNSTILKYYPDLQTKISCQQIKANQESKFINALKYYSLRVRFDQKHIPAEYLTLGFEQRLALFNGLMDTDGSISSNKRLEFCVASSRLVEDFCKLALSLGYTYKVYEKQPKYFNKKYNEVRLGHKAYRVLLNYNSKIIPFYCQRKLEMYNKNIGDK